MTTAKTRVTITLPADLLAAAKTSADGNLSAYIERALRAQLLRAAGGAIAVWRTAAEDAEELADLFGEDSA